MSCRFRSNPITVRSALTSTEREAAIRIVNSKVLNRDTIMPAFHKWKGLHRVLKKFRGKTILTAEEVEDVIAYVMTLK